MVLEKEAENVNFGAVEELQPKPLKKEKVKDLKIIYQKFAPNDRCLEVLKDFVDDSATAEECVSDENEDKVEEDEDADSEDLNEQLWEVPSSASTATPSSSLSSSVNHCQSDNNTSIILPVKFFYGKRI